MRYLAVVLLLAGCSSLNQAMTPDQIAAIVKDKNGTVVCATATGTGGVVKVIVANLDETKGLSGTVTVDPDCKTTITSITPPKETTPKATP